jgi:ADP-ribose pyrophosphatase YjhB (NUDIX family)
MAHINDPGIDFTVEVFIVHEDRVLLRFHDKYDIWLSVGGHIEGKEDPIEAAHREVMEEVGLEIELLGDDPADDDARFNELARPFALGKHRISETHEHVTFVYLARSSSNHILAADGEPVASCRWLNRTEIETDPELSADVRRYAIAALDAAQAAQRQ